MKNQKILLYLEGSLSKEEHRKIEEELSRSLELRSEIEQISQVLDLSAHRSGLCISERRVEAISESITHGAKKVISRRSLSLAIAGAAVVMAVLLVAVLPFETSNQPVSLDWETEELRLLSRDMEVAGVMMEDDYWFGTWGSSELLENTDRSLLELALQMDRLEAAVESQEERVKQ